MIRIRATYNKGGSVSYINIDPETLKIPYPEIINENEEVRGKSDFSESEYERFLLQGILNVLNEHIKTKEDFDWEIEIDNKEATLDEVLSLVGEYI